MKEINQSPPAWRLQQDTAYYTSDTDTHLAMSYSNRPQVIEGLASNEHINKEVFLSLATNQVLAIELAVNLAKNPNWGVEFFNIHKEHHQSKIADAVERIAAIERGDLSSEYESQELYLASARGGLEYRLKELALFEMRAKS